MNKANIIINKFSLAGDKFMPESILLLKNTVSLHHLQNIHKEFKIF